MQSRDAKLESKRYIENTEKAGDPKVSHAVCAEITGGILVELE